MKYFLLILLASIKLWGQTITGNISDKVTDVNLSGVNIIVEGSDIGASSNFDGTYELDISGLNSIQKIKFQHIGYDEVTFTISVLNISSNIKMSPRVLQFEAIETAGAKRKAAIAKDLPQTVAIIQAEEFELRAFVDAGDLLSTDQSIQVEESLSGRKTISIRGGNADDVLVLYNGFRLNRPYDNVFDLSLIDMQNVEQIEIVKGGHSVLYGPDAFSGVVNIVPKNTKDKNLKFSQQFGSYDSGFWNVIGQVQMGKTFLSVNQKKGSYKRIFEELEEDSNGLLTSLTHNAVDMNKVIDGDKINGSLELNFTQDKQTFNNTRDLNTINSTNKLLGVQYSGVLSFLGEVDIAYASHNLSEDQGLSNATSMISRSLNHDAQKFDTRKYIDLGIIEWMFGAQIEKSKLKFWDNKNSPNINQVGLLGANLYRNQFGLATVLKIHSKGDKAGHWLTDLDVSFRQDKVKDHKSNLNFRADHNQEGDFSFLDFGENKWENKIFKISTIASKRLPGRTIAYWVTTGNNVKFPTLQQQIGLTDVPNNSQKSLTPEKMKSLEIGINFLSQPKDISNINSIEFQGSFFRNDYLNKMRVTYLLGMPVGYYENIGIANMMGVEGKIKMKTYDGRIISEMGFSKYNVSDLSAFPFKSIFKVTTSMTVKWKYFSIGSRWFHEGEQVGMVNVPGKGFNEIELPAFTNYDIFWTLQLSLGSYKGQLSYSGRNLEKNDTSINGLLLRDTRKYFTFSMEL
ncbi:MAG: TonB-dependent receptor [Fidelibacterota bacterium]|jgi:outer membrane cobalamin receptor|nr:TonB-dependent receptor [Candidatus Neomarinimicrobiota bacterium]|tara:strand:+ start:2295 stop:4514 length:2220 start_codon:yes stop_codon:yes gene_type:complete